MEKFWHSAKQIDEQPLAIEVGDLTAVISHMKHEWRLNYHWSNRGNQGRFLARYLEQPPAQESEGSSQHRIAMEKMTDRVSLAPQLADRPVIVRPYSPLIIPANNRITLYVSIPIWLCIRFSEKISMSLPTQRLSESWMGSLTGEGELCYGSYTHARLDPELLPKLPYRALTPATIHNQNDRDATLERLSIPAPYLSLYQQQQQLVTEPLKITMDSERHRGVVQIGRVSKKQTLTPARLQADKGVLVSAWENLFA